MKYVSWMWMSTGVAAIQMPVRPPMMNMPTKDRAKSIGVLRSESEPRQIVPSQLNTLMALGSAMNIVETMKVMPRYGIHALT